MVIPFVHLAVMQIKVGIGEAIQIAGVIAAVLPILEIRP
jgi:hypothetical protein